MQETLNFVCYSEEIFLDCIGSQDTVSDSKGFERYLAKGRRSSQGLLDLKWSSMLKKLKDYKQQENGDCNVPRSEKKLSQWVVAQRQAYKARKRNLSKERIDALNEIGFEWDPYEAAWRLRFEELKAYKKENGHCNMPRSEGKLGLWMWVKNQRARKLSKKRKLSKERIDALNEIGFEWKK